MLRARSITAVCRFRLVRWMVRVWLICTISSISFAQSATPPTAATPPAEEELNLDALLDLAEQDPGRLQSVQVKEASREGLQLSPEAVFRPDSGAGSAANSTGDLLSNAPGVIVRSTSAVNQDARIRGYSGAQVVGIADGVNQGRTRLDIDSLFSQIDPRLVQDIAVIAGPYSVLHGPGFAFFDARLITPQRTDQFAWDTRTFLGYNANGGQLTWRETAQFSDQHSGALVSFGQRIGNDYNPGRGSTDFRVPASYNVHDVYAALSIDTSDRTRIDASYLRQVIQNTELPGVAYDINQQHADQLQFRWSLRDDLTGRDRVQAQFWWNQAAYQVDASRPSKQQTFWDRLIAEPYPDTAGGTLVGQGLSDNWGARFLTIWEEEDAWQVKSGVDWRRIRQFYSENDLQADGSPALFGDTFGIPTSSTDDFGAFAGGTVQLTDRWTVGAGQRIDAVAYSVDQNDLVATTGQFSPNGDFYPGFNTATRMLTTSYLTSSFRASDTLTFNAGTAFAMRPPNLTELYSDQPFAPLVRFGNSFAFGDSNLDSEKNLQFDLGVTSKHEGTTLGARAFHSTIRDYIGLAATNYGSFPELGTVPTGTLGRGQPYMLDPNVPNQDPTADAASIGYLYRNIDRVTIYGFDLMAEHRVQPWLEAVGTLTFTEGINHNPTWVDVYTGTVTPVSNREGLPGIYPLSSTLALRLVEPTARKWTLEWQSRLVHQQYYLASSLGELGTPGFDVHNIHATYRWTDHISLRSSLLNVLNTNYYEHNSLAIVDRNGNIGFVKNPGISWYLGVECSY